MMCIKWLFNAKLQKISTVLTGMFTLYRKPSEKEIAQGSHVPRQNKILDGFTSIRFK